MTDWTKVRTSADEYREVIPKKSSKDERMDIRMRQKGITAYTSLESGDKLKFFYQIGNINNRTLHVRGRVDNVLIVRRWSPRKGWIYETMGFWSFQVPYSAGSLKVIKRKDGYEKEDQSGIPAEGAV